MRSVRLRNGLLVAGGLVLAVGLLALWMIVELEFPTRRSRQGPGTVRIPTGASLRQVMDLLADSGWVRQPRLLALWGRREGWDRRLLPGRYRILQGSSPRQVLAEIGSGRVETTRVMIPEGWRASQILSLLADSLEVDPEDLHAAAEDSTWLRSLGLPVPSLEGYLFPETYIFPKEYEPREALARMVRESDARFGEDLRRQCAARGLDRFSVVVLASIVQAEAARREEMPRIASVFLRRLRLGWKLEADPTVLYALARSSGPVLWKDLKVESPYNTYRVHGLPPGPIGNPGTEALRAVLWPDTTRGELYFVAKGNGEHCFSRTLAEHDRARREIRVSNGENR